MPAEMREREEGRAADVPPTATRESALGNRRGELGQGGFGDGIADGRDDLDAGALHDPRDGPEGGTENARRIDARLATLRVERRENPRTQRQCDRRGERERIEVWIVVRSEPLDE